jgi:hypothetical protein
MTKQEGMTSHRAPELATEYSICAVFGKKLILFPMPMRKIVFFFNFLIFIFLN